MFEVGKIYKVLDSKWWKGSQVGCIYQVDEVYEAEWKDGYWVVFETPGEYLPLKVDKELAVPDWLEEVQEGTKPKISKKDPEMLLLKLSEAVKENYCVSESIQSYNSMEVEVLQKEIGQYFLDKLMEAFDER